MTAGSTFHLKFDAVFTLLSPRLLVAKRGCGLLAFL